MKKKKVKKSFPVMKKIVKAKEEVVERGELVCDKPHFLETLVVLFFCAIVIFLAFLFPKMVYTISTDHEYEAVAYVERIVPLNRFPSDFIVIWEKPQRPVGKFLGWPENSSTRFWPCYFSAGLPSGLVDDRNFKLKIRYSLPYYSHDESM